MSEEEWINKCYREARERMNAKVNHGEMTMEWLRDVERDRMAKQEGLLGKMDKILTNLKNLQKEASETQIQLRAVTAWFERMDRQEKNDDRRIRAINTGLRVKDHDRALGLVLDDRFAEWERWKVLDQLDKCIRDYPREIDDEIVYRTLNRLSMAEEGIDWKDGANE